MRPHLKQLFLNKTDNGISQHLSLCPRSEMTSVSCHSYPDDVLVEIIASIAELDKHASLCNFSLVSKQFARLAQPQLFNSVSMTIQDDVQGLTFCERVLSSPHLFEQTIELKLTEQRLLDERGRVIEDIRWRTTWLSSSSAAKMFQKLPVLSILELNGFTMMEFGQFEEPMRVIATHSTISTLRFSAGVVRRLEVFLGLFILFPTIKNLEIIGVSLGVMTAKIPTAGTPLLNPYSASATVSTLKWLHIRNTRTMPQLISELHQMGCLFSLQGLNVEVNNINEAKEILSTLRRVAPTLLQLHLRLASSLTEAASVWPDLGVLEPNKKPMSLVSISGIRPRDVRWTSQLLETLMPTSNSRHVQTLELNLHVHWPRYAKHDIWSTLDEVARRADSIRATVDVVMEAVSSKGIDPPAEAELAQRILPASRAHEDFTMSIRMVDHCTSIPESDDETPEPVKNARQWDQFMRAIGSTSAPKPFDFGV